MHLKADKLAIYHLMYHLRTMYRSDEILVLRSVRVRLIACESVSV